MLRNSSNRATGAPASARYLCRPCRSARKSPALSICIAWAEALALADPDRPLFEQLYEAFLHVTRHHEADQELARSFFKELLFVSEPVRTSVTHFMRGYLSQLAAVVEEAKRRGKVDPDVPVVPLVNNLFAAWYLMMQRRHTGATSIAEAELQLWHSFHTALFGLVPRSELPPKPSP